MADGTLGYGDSSWAPWQGYCPTETTCYNTSYLVELNPETGAVIDYIGEVGYRVNGLAFDPTSGKLYGGTSPRDPNFIGLIEIDITTGAGTRVGTGWSNVSHVAAITVNPGGQMYGWTEDGDDLVSINKTTGVATIVGDSGIGTGDHGLSFNSAGELYLVLYRGLAYRVDTSTGSATLADTFYDYTDAHHGKFDWLTDLFYTISWSAVPVYVQLIVYSAPTVNIFPPFGAVTAITELKVAVQLVAPVICTIPSPQCSSPDQRRDREIGVARVGVAGVALAGDADAVVGTAQLAAWRPGHGTRTCRADRNAACDLLVQRR
ncbi:MAG: hypothetical protein ACM3SX_20535 [Deltaproteobacteria bacterium]